ncbi:MAG: redox-sensing transcriptional repressor Rex [Lactobacillus sp.]|jgi:redox-sensing transcriptional repressor|uniref:Redox-sensing transcriptional repressor Rex n=1 Tax=Lacticaseibacillus suilingensis TaxID=2799577 RepID=A0ABW4BG07_9LACO|nr:MULTISPECIES: redox-sensing transcriptional repressor Rex [Lacticaseibacillus]MCI1894441.1 redox-sensing transcriptional repressor Rex [Lactobacillus sp.]MCI1917013.1 redox-sensing transcriptional repressor Rex [Lactobacillus sp.]MCI1941738.1 redox-sensing transcriptional repressor Rex [Lactobacillus sp.]MCI1972325.1 redox-sensing transcriptional repressor Rex [Lactobacillus sp.]MCI2016865.1 redox-sensing transcriptional repressor Rex [Lactobacillus sp.]
MQTTKTHVSKATINRIPLYYRAVRQLQQEGIRRIRSHRLSEIIHIPSATIRRDFSSFGEMGKSGYGYSIETLVKAFGQLLDVDSAEAMILVGVGGLGAALMQNNFRRNPDLNIVMAFDSDPAKVGQPVGGIPVYAFATLAAHLESTIHTAIVAVPSSAQTAVINQLEAAGISAILTFAPQPVACRPETTIRYIDLTSELQSLLYTAHQKQHATKMTLPKQKAR